MSRQQEEVKKHICAALLAHVDAGKTTLSESILYTTGSIRKPGRVDHGDAFLDTHALERARGITIFSKQAVFELPGKRVTLLDTPGHVDFSAEMERTLS
ncbi:MAG: GTP-binding protein, partial [Catenibacillus sp.]|nr:GTP-binding protein [Catenibacillus sp.]